MICYWPILFIGAHAATIAHFAGEFLVTIPFLFMPPSDSDYERAKEYARMKSGSCCPSLVSCCPSFCCTHLEKEESARDASSGRQRRRSKHSRIDFPAPDVLKQMKSELKQTRIDRRRDRWKMRGKKSKAQIFSGTDSLFELLRPTRRSAAPVMFLRGSWLMARAAALRNGQGSALPRRQQLWREEPTAFLTLDSSRRYQSARRSWLPLRIICVSHCWHGPTHPDPLGEQLIRLADLIEKQNDATCSGSVFPTGEFAVFFDFARLCKRMRMAAVRRGIMPSSSR